MDTYIFTPLSSTSFVSVSNKVANWMLIIITTRGTLLASTVPSLAPWESPCGTPSTSNTELAALFNNTVSTEKQTLDLKGLVDDLKGTIDYFKKYKQKMVSSMGNNMNVVNNLMKYAPPSFLALLKEGNVATSLKGLLQHDYERISKLLIFVQGCRMDREGDGENEEAQDLKGIEKQLYLCLCKLFLNGIRLPSTLSQNHTSHPSRALHNMNDFVVSEGAVRLLESIKDSYQLKSEVQVIG